MQSDCLPQEPQRNGTIFHELEKIPGASDELIEDNLISFIIGGHDTTAHAMAFTICQLQKNPSCLERAIAEVDSVLGHARLPTASQLTELPYLTSCIKVR